MGLCFKFIVHITYLAVEAALFRLMDLLATEGELSRARCDVSMLSCVCHTAFTLGNEELQAVTALGGSLWKSQHEELGRRQTAPCLLYRIEMTDFCGCQRAGAGQLLSS